MVNVKMLYICHGINVVMVLLKVGSLGYSQIMTCVPTSDFVHMLWNKRGYVFKVGSLGHSLLVTCVLRVHVY